MKHLSLLVLAGVLLLGANGCSYNVGYNPNYISAQPMTLGLAGKSLVVMNAVDASWSYSGKPSSFTGSGTTLTIPLGEITKQVALKVFGAAFKDGADFRTVAGDASAYRLVVSPKLGQFSYAYNQLKNLGFAVTPQVQLDLRVTLTTPDGKTLLDKTYPSGLTDGDSFMVSGQPSEKVNQILHQVLFKLMTDAAVEAKGLLDSNHAHWSPPSVSLRYATNPV